MTIVDRAPAEADVAIVGGGLTGLALGCALARHGFAVAVVDRDPPRAQTGDAFDGRASAIALASARALQALGLWDEAALAPEPILEIRVSDGEGPLFLHYDHRQVGDAPLGWMVENRRLRRLLVERAAVMPGLAVLGPAAPDRLDRGTTGVRLELARGQGRVAARLAVGADGKGSWVREQAGIRAAAFDYPQAGIVCTVRHERPHRGIAHERFLPAGPFAILPLAGNRSSLVWTERRDLAPALMALPEGEFLEELARRFGDFLGVLALEGPRWSYPLGLVHAERYVERRVALIGDAAHAIHPIAGQGFNLGLRDVAALVEVLVEGRRLGLEAGDAAMLRRYGRWRRTDAIALAAVTDGLNRLFSTDLAAVRLARDLGLAVVHRTPPLKRLFMRHAMGTLGALPRLLRGEAP